MRRGARTLMAVSAAALMCAAAVGFMAPAASAASKSPAGRSTAGGPARKRAAPARERAAPAQREAATRRRTHAKKAPPPPEVTLPVQTAGTPGYGVTMRPVGLSFEYPLMAEYLGSGSCPAPALVSALRQLGSPPISLAGSSQDMTVPSGALASALSSWEQSIMYTLPAGFWSQLHCLLSEAGDPLTVGLNMRTGTLAWAEAMVAGARSAATDGLSFSLGNEPDLYYVPNYSSLGKPVANEEAAAVNLYLQLATQLEGTLGGEAVIGPELATAGHWKRELPRVLATLHDQTLGVHAYPLSACTTPKAVTLSGLLSEEAADAPRSLAWAVADATAAGVPAIISEANSASCGGVAGVSDSPAAAVWAVRFVVAALETGFREVRFHFSGDPYDAFVLNGTELLQRPLYAALVALNEWLPVGASLHPLTGVRGLVATAVSGGLPDLILEDRQGSAQAVVLRSAAPVRVQTLGVTQAGVQSVVLSPTHDRIKLTLAPNSVAALTVAA